MLTDFTAACISSCRKLYKQLVQKQAAAAAACLSLALLAAVQIYLLMWVPWPLPAPEIVNYAVGVDMLDTEHECVLVATKHHNKLPVSHPARGCELAASTTAGWSFSNGAARQMAWVLRLVLCVMHAMSCKLATGVKHAKSRHEVLRVVQWPSLAVQVDCLWWCLAYATNPTSLQPDVPIKHRGGLRKRWGATTMVLLGGLPSAVQDGVKLPVHGRTMRIDMKAGGFKFRPLPPHPDRPGVARTETTVLVAIDAGIAMSSHT